MSRAYSDHIKNTRGSGLTTLTAFHLIAEALANPGVKVLVRDHYPTQWAHVDLTKRIKEIANAAGIELEVNAAACQITAPVRGVQALQYIRRDA